MSSALKEIQAGQRIQRAWRGKSGRLQAQFERLVRMFMHIRSLAALQVQRWWRGARIRNVLIEVPDKKVILRWRWDSSSTPVYVAGDFSNWVPRRMLWCATKSEHRLAVPTRSIRSIGVLRYKFVVNRIWTCDGSLPMDEDTRGNVNNLCIIFPASQADRTLQSTKPGVSPNPSISDGLDGASTAVTVSSPGGASVHSAQQRRRRVSRKTAMLAYRNYSSITRLPVLYQPSSKTTISPIAAKPRNGGEWASSSKRRGAAPPPVVVGEPASGLTSTRLSVPAI
jgi:hypothetical protein